MEEKKEIETLLTEFTALRTETTYLQQSEASMSTMTFSFIAAILGLNYLLSNGNESDTTHFSQCIILVLCPILLMFFGCLWMDLLFRRIRYGAYLYLLEADINRLVDSDEQKIYFEHWIIGRELGRSFFRKTSRFYGYVVFGTMLIVPVLLYLFADLTFPSWKLLSPEWDILNLAKEHILWCIFLLLVYIIYIIIMCFYTLEILDLKNLGNFTKRVPPN